jgi:hypothetical protein
LCLAASFISWISITISTYVETTVVIFFFLILLLYTTTLKPLINFSDVKYKTKNSIHTSTINVDSHHNDIKPLLSLAYVAAPAKLGCSSIAAGGIFSLSSSLTASSLSFFRLCSVSTLPLVSS